MQFVASRLQRGRKMRFCRRLAKLADSRLGTLGCVSNPQEGIVDELEVPPLHAADASAASCYLSG
jgi:hypothetical protein